MRFATCSFVAVSAVTLAAVAWLSLERHGPVASAATRLADAADGNAALRLGEKNAVLHQFVAGELTLREAAARFRDVDRALPPAGARRVPGEEDMPEGEWYCRQVIRWAQAQAAADPSGPADAVVRRAAGDLDVALQSGPIELPPVP
jgi:hypothetical protein